MSASFAHVFVDIGNTSVGFGLAPEAWTGAIARERSFPVRELATAAGEAALCEWLERRGARGARAWVASVQRPARTAAIVDTLEAAGIPVVGVNPASGLALALRRPETCGLDRQLAARAALEGATGPVIVVSAGTALTVDVAVPVADPRGRAAFREVVGAEVPAGAHGVFLGGAIAPGPRLAAEALARGGARLFGVDGFDAAAPALGRESAEALRSGVVHGFIGAARELTRRVAQAAGCEAAAVRLTGGAAHLVVDALTADWGAALVAEPGLVLSGLASAAKEGSAWTG